MRVDALIGKILVEEGIHLVFGVVGSGNFHITNKMVEQGARFVASRHESGAVTMADAAARMLRQPVAASVHQGPGFTNAITALVEASKSRSPMVLVAAQTPLDSRGSNFWLAQAAVTRAADIATFEVTSAEDAEFVARNAVRFALRHNASVCLHVPNDIQELEAPQRGEQLPNAVQPASSIGELPEDVMRALEASTRPVFLLGRGGRHAADEVRALADRYGALLATTAPMRGVFADHPWSVDVSGGFASPAAVDLLKGADLVVAWGASLNRWTTMNGTLIKGKHVVHVDSDEQAFGRHYGVSHPVIGDAQLVAQAMLREETVAKSGYRTPEVGRTIEQEVGWDNEPFDDNSTPSEIDPRTFSLAIDEKLPAQRVLSIDGGNFNCYPAMLLDAPDPLSMCLPLSFQSIGLALAAGIGAAIALPERTAIVGVGDGGFMMSHVELDTAVRLNLDVVVLVYNDNAYGAEVHHFGPLGEQTEIVAFPPTDIAAIAAGYGCESVVVRSLDDVRAIQRRSPGDGPLVVDARITSFPSWLLSHTFDAE